MEESVLNERIRFLAKLLGAEILHEGKVPQPALSYWSDSRKVRPGDGFFALQGKVSDGHNFLEDALARGAVEVFAQKDRWKNFPTSLPQDRVVFFVESTEKALHALGEQMVSKLSLERTIAVTGSVGKTTTKQLIQKVLALKYSTYATRESFNTSIGIDLALASIPPETKALVLEFGTNSFGEIRELAQRYKPQIGVITEVAQVHTQGLGSLEGVLKAKTEILESPDMTHLFFNADRDILASQAHVISSSKTFLRTIPVGWNVQENQGVGIKNTEIVRNKSEITRNPFYLESEISLFGKPIFLRVPSYCKHHIYGYAFALGVAEIMGIHIPRDATDVFGTFRIPSGRGEVFKASQGFYIFDESYNANPHSMKSSLESFLSLPLEGRKILVLGGMKELGELAPKGHEEILSFIPSDITTFFVGQEWHLPEVKKLMDSRNYRETIWVDCGEELIPMMKRFLLQENDALFVKGSRSYALDKLVQALLEAGC